MKKDASVMGGPGKDFTADYTDLTDKHLPSLTQSRKGAKAQRGKAATKGFEQEQTEETEKETESRKVFVENAQLWWMALQRVFSGLASLRLCDLALSSFWFRLRRAVHSAVGFCWLRACRAGVIAVVAMMMLFAASPLTVLAQSNGSALTDRHGGNAS